MKCFRYIAPLACLTVACLVYAQLSAQPGPANAGSEKGTGKQPAPTITEIRIPARSAEDDPAFERYADPKALGTAWEKRDAGALADIALQFAAGERVLGRAHRAPGLSASKLLDLTIRLAADTRDADTLKRLASIAAQRKDTDLGDRIKAAQQLLAAPRAVNAALEKLLAESVTAQEILREAQATKLTGNRAQLDALVGQLAKQADLKPDEITLLKKELKTIAESLPEKATGTELANVLERLVGGTRGTAVHRLSIRNNVPFAVRLWLRISGSAAEQITIQPNQEVARTAAVAAGSPFQFSFDGQNYSTLPTYPAETTIWSLSIAVQSQ